MQARRILNLKIKITEIKISDERIVSAGDNITSGLPTLFSPTVAFLI